MHIRFILPLLVATALTAPALADDHISAWRLFIADHAQPSVTALDLATGDTLATVPLASPAALYTTGEAVYAVQGAGNQVSAITEGSSAKAGVLDPEGGALEEGAELYPALLRGLAASLVDCLQ